MNRPRPRITAAAALTAALAALPGCSADPSAGYSFESSFDASVRTVAVPIFDNTTFETGLETELTEAITKRIQQDTPWRVSNAPAADTELTGTITEARLFTLSRTRGTGLPQEQVYEITVDFTWRDNRTGTTLVQRERFASAGAFVPDRLTGERIEIGRREATSELARSIVAELRTGW